MEKQTEINSLPEKKGSKTNKLLIAIIILLFCFCGYLIWQNLELQKLLEAEGIALTEVTSERDKVQGDLEEMLAQGFFSYGGIERGLPVEAKMHEYKKAAYSCQALDASLLIDSNGDVYPCCYLFDDNVGNVAAARAEGLRAVRVQGWSEVEREIDKIL